MQLQATLPLGVLATHDECRSSQFTTFHLFSPYTIDLWIF